MVPGGQFSLAIQIHGGYGYTRDFPVEQYWRDNRLNMIHEGTHGIQGMDLLGRKVLMDGGQGPAAAGRAHQATIERAGQVPGLAPHANALARRCSRWAPPPSRLGHRQPDRGAGQRRALPAGLWPCGAGLDLAGRGADAQQLFDLTPGKTALVTGGSRGLGLQMAHALGEAGAKIMLSSRKATPTWKTALAGSPPTCRPKPASIARWIAADCRPLASTPAGLPPRHAEIAPGRRNPAAHGRCRHPGQQRRRHLGRARPKTTRWKPGTR
jgi:hypothetical protein